MVDAQILAEILVEKMDFRLLLRRSPRDEPVEVEQLSPGQSIMLCRVKDLELFRPTYIPSTKEWWFDHDYNPTVEWMISREKGGMLHPGRFYYQAEFWEERKRVLKSEEFVRHAEKTLRLVRANCIWHEVPWGRVRIGENVEARLASHDVGLAMN